MDQEGRRLGRSRRAAVRDFHRQGRCGDPVARRRRADRDRRQGRRDGSGEQRRRDDRRRGRSECQTRAAGALQVPRVRNRCQRLRSQSAQADGTPGADRRRASAAIDDERCTRRTRTHPRTRMHPRHPHAPDAPEAGGDRHKSSPLVRKIAKEHNVDIGQIQGSGIGGRVTKQDILGFIDSGSGDRDPAIGDAPAPDRRRRRSTRGVGRPGRPDVGDAQEDRRAHGAQQAHLRARLLGVRGELLARRSDSQGEEGRLRARRREADLHLVHRQGRRSIACAATRRSTPRSTATTSSITTTSISASRSRSRTA